jgi:hypothetical protein
MFFDSNNMISQFEERNELFKLKKEKRYYQKEIVNTQKDLTALLTSNSHLEQYAREKFQMKKDNEEALMELCICSLIGKLNNAIREEENGDRTQFKIFRIMCLPCGWSGAVVI